MIRYAPKRLYAALLLLVLLAAYAGQNICKGLRRGGKHYRARLRGDFKRIAHGYAQLVCQSVCLFARAVEGKYVAGCNAARDHAADYCGSHAAGADECVFHEYLLYNSKERR